MSELKKRLGDQMIKETHDSMTVVFAPGGVAYTRRPAWVRDRMAAALNRWYEQSTSW